jgi:hypothetical protein
VHDRGHRQAGATSSPKGQVRTNVLGYVPAGALADQVRAGSGRAGRLLPEPPRPGGGRQDGQLKPGDLVVIDYDPRAGSGQPGFRYGAMSIS